MDISVFRKKVKIEDKQISVYGTVLMKIVERNNNYLLEYRLGQIKKTLRLDALNAADVNFKRHVDGFTTYLFIEAKNVISGSYYTVLTFALSSPDIERYNSFIQVWTPRGMIDIPIAKLMPLE